MPQVDRRRFLQLAGGSVAALSASSLMPSIARAASIPAHRATGTIRDIEHIVVLMQENRSFDHYFGALRGVRGFGDPHPAVQPNGKSVWHQADGSSDVLPFRPDQDNLALTFIEDLDHSWDPTHAAVDGGNYDQWVPQKTAPTMAHLQRKDLPFHYALADAFTVCDAYHCSLLGPTDPNRYYMWTGGIGNDQPGGGPVIANDEIGYSWTTYPERLQQAGVSWKIYQDVGVGLDAAGYWGWTSDPYIGNYGDNSLLYFTQYQNAAPGSPLYQGARTGTNVSASGGFFDILTADVKAGTLPQVSWIVAPEAYTEHPAWPAGYGAWYVAGVLDALTSNPAVWSKTALIINFDENDGFFDHVVPPLPNVGPVSGASTVSTAGELFAGTAGTPGGSNGTPGPIGLGVRVPALVVSPWSTGGWVCSETFDHTSVIRFIEKRFGVHEPNITPWRRAVCGDLTSAFDFGRSQARVPGLPSTAAYKPDEADHPTYVPVPPATGVLPKQERGVRPSRALGYGLDVRFSQQSDKIAITIVNGGKLGAGVQARSLTLPDAPWSYTVGAGHHLDASWSIDGDYDLSLHGPNGFFRRYAGASSSTLQASVSQVGRTGVLRLQLALPRHGHSTAAAQLHVVDAYGRDRVERLRPGGSADVVFDTVSSGGWYDLTVTVSGDSAFAQQFAGRLETGRPGTSDPQLGS